LDVADVEKDGELHAAQEEEPSWVQRYAVPIVFCVFVTMRAMDRVFNKRVTDRMTNYVVMYTNIFWPIGVQLMTYVMVGGYVAYMRFVAADMRYDWRFFLPGAAIASGMGAIPMWKFGMFSIFDQLNACITNLPSPFINMTSQSILTNFGLVWTVLFSLVWLKTRYAQEHYIGCILVVLSGLVAVTVEMQTGSPPLGRYKTATGVWASSSAMWYLIYIVGTVPQGISNCYKQLLLKDVDLEVMYATLWSGNWQVLWGLLLFPMNWIPLPSPAVADHPSQTGEYLSRAWECFHGTAPTSYNTTTGSTYISQNDAVCASPGGNAFQWFLVYLCFNITFNLLFLWLVKRMSATWATIATVLCLDLTSLLSMSTFLEGIEAQPVTFEQYLGLIIAGMSMWVYNLKEELDQNGDAISGTKAQAERSDLMRSATGAVFAANSFDGRLVMAPGSSASFHRLGTSWRKRTGIEDPHVETGEVASYWQGGRVGGGLGRYTISY